MPSPPPPPPPPQQQQEEQPDDPSQLILSPLEQARRHDKLRRRHHRRRLLHQSEAQSSSSLLAPSPRDCPAPNNDIPWTGRLPFLWQFSISIKPDWSVIPDLQGVDALRAFSSQWVPVAASSPAFFAVNALVTEAVATRSRPDVYSAARLAWIKHHALALINRGLHDSRQQLADHMILCVATMVYYEWFWGSKRASHLHHQGLRRMVNLRGGVAALGDPRLITCFSNAISYLSGQAPVLEPPNQGFAFVSRVDHPIRFALRSRHPAMTRRHHEQFIMLLGLWNPAQQLIDILQRIQELASIPLTGPLEYAVALEECRNIEEALLECHAPYGTAVRMDSGQAEDYEVTGDQLYACTRLAMFVVLHTYAELKLGGIESKADHAVMAFGTMPLWKLVEAEPIIILWSLFMAAPWAHGIIRDGWVDLINDACRRLELEATTEWGEVKGLLRQIAYIPALHDEPCSELWDECLRSRRQARSIEATPTASGNGHAGGE